MNGIGGLVAVVFAVVVLAAVASLAISSWRRRNARDADLAAFPAPTNPGPARFETSAQYVATTKLNSPLDKVHLANMQFRGPVRLSVYASGVEVCLAGAPTAFIPATQIVGIGVASYAIDRAAPDGLLALTWQCANQQDPTGPLVDSYFRIVSLEERASFRAAVSSLARTQSGGGSPDAG